MFVGQPDEPAVYADITGTRTELPQHRFQAGFGNVHVLLKSPLRQRKELTLTDTAQFAEYIQDVFLLDG